MLSERLREQVRATACLAVLIFVAFFAAYAGENLARPSPRPAHADQIKEAISGAGEEQSQTKKSVAGQLPLVESPTPAC
jgi:hypothetical protein